MEENIAALDIRAINEKIEKRKCVYRLCLPCGNKVMWVKKHMIERLPLDF
jgi:MoxR-like ATPase